MNKSILSLCAVAMLCLLNSCSILSSVDDGSYNGIDVSHYQGDIDWDAVKTNKNIKFVYIKTSEGATVTDARRVEYSTKAHAKKFLVGYYHFFRVTSSGEDQFRNFCNSIRGLRNDLIPVLDIEVEPKANEMAKFEEGITTFIKLCKQTFGVEPIIYTMPNFDKKYLPFCQGMKKWFAGNNERYIGEKDMVIWQLAIQPVPGIAGKTDQNYCHKIRNIRKSLSTDF